MLLHFNETMPIPANQWLYLNCPLEGPAVFGLAALGGAALLLNALSPTVTISG